MDQLFAEDSFAYTLLGSKPVSWASYTQNGKLYIPIHDLHGNVALLLFQGVAEEYHYSAFGERLSSGTLSPWGFSSKRTDFETGFVYFGRRYYIPEFGRWSTADPLGYEAGSNLYAYVSNAPLNRVDLYVLFDVRREIPDFIKDSSNWESPPIDYKQPAIGIIHGVGDFGFRTGANLGAIGWGLTQPFSACDRPLTVSPFNADF